jgi:hypothetical protein
MNAVTTPEDVLQAATAADCAQALHELVERAREMYFPPAAPMRLDIVALDGPESGRRLEFGGALESTDLDFTPGLPRAEPERLAFEPGWRAATIRLPATALAWLADHPHEVDLRHADFAAAHRGLLAIEGDAIVVDFWLQLIKRPTPRARDALERSRIFSPRTPTAIDILPGGPLDAPHATRSVERAILHRLPCLLRNSLGAVEPRWMAAFEAAADGDYSGGAPSLPAMADAIAWPRLAPQAYQGVQLWAGRSRTGVELTRLHCDPLTSLLAQLVGRKHLLLFSPQEHDRLYPIASYNGYQPCRVDARRPDIRRFPLFFDARAVLVTMLPGDLLVIPTGWFHTTWSPEPVASLSRFVDDDLLD